MSKAIKKKYSGILNVAEENTKKAKIFKLFCFIILSVITCISLLPLIWTLLSAFKPLEEYYSVPATFFPKKFEWHNFTDLFSEYKIQHYIFNSVVQIIGSLIVEITFAATAGFVISKIKPVGAKLIFTLILWTMMMPTTLAMVPLFMTFINFPILHISLMNTYVPMWLMAGANCFHIMMFKDFFDGIPTSYIEAAHIDGAGHLQIFYRIILPLSKPIIATLSVFVITENWNGFLWPYLLLKDKKIITISLAAFKFRDKITEPQALMMSLILIIPMIIVYIISQKFVVDNDNAAGDKG